MFKKIKSIGKKDKDQLEDSEQRKKGSGGGGVSFDAQEKDPRGGSDR